MSSSLPPAPNTSSSPTTINHFRWTEADAYFFDIDGTLLKSRDRVHFQALNIAMQTVYGMDTTIAGVPYHGMTDLGILRAALERVGISGNEFSSKLPAALKVVRDYVDQQAATLNPHVFDAIPEVLDRLKRSQKFLGVASGNLESVGWHKLRAAGLHDFFTCGYFADQCETRAEIFSRAAEHARKAIRPDASIVFVGDTPSDILAAHQAGAKVIAVATGTFSLDDLQLHQPDTCVAPCSELMALS
jgi:phosphoglycolate phosphatase-like HAD superfamily hydrolase